MAFPDDFPPEPPIGLPAQPSAEPPTEIVMRRTAHGFRRVRRPLPAELRDAPLLYRFGFWWPWGPLSLLVLVAGLLALAGAAAAVAYFQVDVGAALHGLGSGGG